MKKFTVFLAVCAIMSSGCRDKNNDFVPLFTIEDDVQLGAQLHQEITNNPQEFPLLDETAYAEEYAYLQGLCNKILATGDITYKDEFVWKVHIIDQDVLNAFAAPGGYMYFYTGLIKYLEHEDDLMGVMGHEMAHADQRHSVKQMQQVYGIQLLLSIALGNNPSQLEQILAGIAGQSVTLKFSRDDEREADMFSVDYLADTEYRCDGAATFFQKLINEGQASGGPEFLSTHPNPENRVEAIRAEAAELGCDTTYFDPDSYQTFQNSLP